MRLNGTPATTEEGTDMPKCVGNTLTVKVPVAKWHPVASVPVTVKILGPSDGGTPQ